MSRVGNGETRAYGRSAGLLTAALASAGALAYLYFAVASHTLGKDDYGQIVVLWSVAFLAVSILFRPVEQLLARTVADLEERGQSIRHACRVAAGIQLGLGGAFAVGALAFRGPIEDRLFDGEALFFWVMLGAVLAFSAGYFARGFFAGSRRMGAYAALLVVEGAARLGLALAVAVGIANGTTPMAIAIAVAPLLSLLVVPYALARSARPAVPGEPRAADVVAVEGAPEFTLAQGSGFAGAVLVIMLSEQVLLNSGVLFVRVTEGAGAAGFIFNVLMVARAPVVLFAAVAASLLPHLTRLRSRGDESSDEAFEVSVRLTITVIAAFAAAVTAGLALVGPTVMQLAFGDNFEYGRAGLLIVAVGMGFYLAAATLSQAALAQGQVRRAALCWLGAGVVFVTINLLPVMGEFRQVQVGFAASAMLLCGSLFLLYRRPHPVAADELRPGSVNELEARLASADEVT